MTTATATATATVDAALTYLVPSDVKPTTYMHVSRRDDIQRDGDYAEFPVTVRDGRAEAADLSLDRQGFVLTRHDTAVEDFYDDALKRLSSELTELTKALLSVLSVRHLSVFSLKPGVTPNTTEPVNRPG